MPPKYTMFTMSDSESEAEREVSNIPSDQVLEKTLRDQVATIFKSGNMEELTVKRVRLAAEDTLGLTAGYFKSTGDWKARSENIIKDEVVRLVCIYSALSDQVQRKRHSLQRFYRRHKTRQSKIHTPKHLKSLLLPRSPRPLPLRSEQNQRRCQSLGSVRRLGRRCPMRKRSYQFRRLTRVTGSQSPRNDRKRQSISHQ